MTATVGRPRRRGAALEKAILDAAWQQLSGKGFENFTYEAVAARAGTSKPVLYRRWPTRSELVVAALRQRITERPIQLPDRGSLRADVIDMLDQINEKRAEMFTLQTGAGLYFEQTHTSPAQLRERARAGLPSSMDRVLARARVRGELRAVVPHSVASLPFELLRAQILMTMVPLSQQAIVSIVDEVFLPLLAAYDHGLVPSGDPDE